MMWIKVMVMLFALFFIAAAAGTYLGTKLAITLLG